MDSYNNFLSWFQATNATVCAVASLFLSEFLESKLGKGISLIITLILVVITFRILENLLDLSIDKFLWLRKLIFGKQFIEGHWVDIVTTDNNSKILYGGLIFIEFEKGKIVFSGTSFTPDGKQFGTFTTSSSDFSNYKLKVSYSGITTEFSTSKVVGYGEFQFDRGSKCPTTYSGFYFEFSDKMIINVQARKIVDREELAKLTLPEERSKYTMQFIESYKHLGYAVQVNT
jgi:hypothetical protein